MNRKTPPHLKPVVELEEVLGQLVAEHRKLLKSVEEHQQAMKTLNLEAMETVAAKQEEIRGRVNNLELRRRSMVQQIAKLNGVTEEPKIPRLAEMYPQRRVPLMHLRNELHAVVCEITGKNQIAGKIAIAVLGHLNSAMRILSGAMEHAGVYTRQGVPLITNRVGVMEAVG